MADSRYQFQSWYVKVYRWLRWMPWAYVRGCWWRLTIPAKRSRVYGPVDTMLPNGSWEVIDQWHWVEPINWFHISISRAQSKMQWYYTSEELLKELGQ